MRKKGEISTLRRFSTQVTALANADGGEVVIGIDDPKAGKAGTDRWNGVASIEDLNGLVQALRQIDPPCSVAVTFLVSVGLPGYVLHLDVEDVEKDAAVHTAPDGKVYQGVSASSVALSQDADPDIPILKPSQGGIREVASCWR